MTSLDPLVHSQRWIRERPLDHAWAQIHRYQRDHYGDRPERLLVSAPVRRELIVAASVDGLAERRSAYAITFGPGISGSGPFETRLFGIPLEVRPDIAGIVAEGPDRHPFSAQRYRVLNQRGGTE